jgi:myo-inositol-1(or 4)-monophosphatase
MTSADASPNMAGTSAGWSAELAAAEELALRAGRLLVERLGNHGTVTYKDPRDIVTEVDRASEALIRDALAVWFPEDAFLGEEGGHEPPPGRRRGRAAGHVPGPLAAGRTWVCDPVDGTINYANGIPFFCVSLALVQDGRPVVGVVHDPMRGEIYAATADGPALLDGRAVRVSRKERLSDYVAALAIGGPRPATRARRVRKAIRISRSMGSAALSLAYVANGRFDAFGQSVGLSSWDIAAAGLIAERAGATVTSLTGGSWLDLAAKPRTSGVLAAPPEFHAQLLALLDPAR